MTTREKNAVENGRFTPQIIAVGIERVLLNHSPNRDCPAFVCLVELDMRMMLLLHADYHPRLPL